MSDGDAVGIDDVDAAAACFAPAIRARLDPVLRELRRELRSIAVVDHGWTLVDYDAFPGWLRPRLNGLPCAVLDKLLPLAATSGTRTDVEAHRELESDAPAHRSGVLAAMSVMVQAPRPAVARGVLVDDAAYTGATLLRAAPIVGARRAFVYVAGETVAARLAAAGVELTACHLVPPAVDIIHLRDAVPWLPWSGRRVAARPPLACAAGVVPLRVAPIMHDGGRWLHLRRDDPLAAAVHRATEAALDALGRGLTVADLPQLGRGLAAPLARPDEPVGCATPLSALLCPR